MSMGPLGAAAGTLGSAYAQRAGADTAQSAEESIRQARQAQAAQKADLAAGVGQTDGEDHETAERDADGRRLWERPGSRKKGESEPAPVAEPPRPRDLTGDAGQSIDFTA